MKHFLLFTGHLIDAENRKTPRFPAHKESAAAKRLTDCLVQIKQNTGETEFCGIAGGASGGDILFHETCQQLEIPSEIYLALPVDEFMEASVSTAGAGWEARYHKLIKELPVHILPKTEATENVWEKANDWMLIEALQNGGKNMTLLALWDGKGGDGPGGTEHMVNLAIASGATVNIIDITAL